MKNLYMLFLILALNCVNSVKNNRNGRLIEESRENINRGTTKLEKILYSINKRDISEFKRLIKKINLKKAIDEDENNLVHYLASINDKEFLKILLDSKPALIRTFNKKFMLPLEVCLKNRNIESAKIIIEKYEEEDFNRIDRYSPLYLVLKYRNRELLKILEKKGVNKEQKEMKDGRNVFHSAIEFCDIESIKSFINFNIDINSKDFYGNFPLYIFINKYENFQKIDNKIKIEILDSILSVAKLNLDLEVIKYYEYDIETISEFIIRINLERGKYIKDYEEITKRILNKLTSEQKDRIIRKLTAKKESEKLKIFLELTIDNLKK